MARKCGADDLMESTLPAAAAEMALVSSSVSPQAQQMQVDEQSSRLRHAQSWWGVRELSVVG